MLLERRQRFDGQTPPGSARRWRRRAGRRMPGMTVDTSGLARMNRSASSGSVMPGRHVRPEGVDAVERRRQLVGREVEVAPVAGRPRHVGGSSCRSGCLRRTARARSRRRRVRGRPGTARPPDSDRRCCRRPARCRRRPVSSAFSTLVGSQRLTLMPKPRIRPSRFRSSTARCQRSSVAHASVQTWNCWRSTDDTPRFSRLVSVDRGCDRRGRRRRARTRRAPATSGSSAGSSWRRRATCRDDARATWPSSCSLLPLAVGERRVEERAAERDRALDRRDRLVVVRPGPAAHAPQAVADFRDGPAEAAEGAHSHWGRVSFPQIWPYWGQASGPFPGVSTAKRARCRPGNGCVRPGG